MAGGGAGGEGWELGKLCIFTPVLAIWGHGCRGCWLAFWIIVGGGGLPSCRHDGELAGCLPRLVTVDSSWFPGQVAAGCGSEFCFDTLSGHRLYTWDLRTRIALAENKQQTQPPSAWELLRLRSSQSGSRH